MSNIFRILSKIQGSEIIFLSVCNVDSLVKSQNLRFWQRQLNELRCKKWVFGTFYESINVGQFIKECAP
ncbi:hypothetical protein H206_02757 [Candidatus Electrothrix aarhusensis]|uniref:Uncharacterized protein n=1 Tax=Candidatus Electrothrix aarhusensis TaxID=1859131 RepID=A0A444IRG9_9BACT|nr:hypothetical protein H206_02757 [Candidatus Electrothrix aarhusensis]